MDRFEFVRRDQRAFPRHVWCFALVLSVASLASAAEWSKMKKCSDLGFCRRHRTSEAQSAPRPVYVADAASVRVSNWRGSTALVGNLRKDGEADALVMFAVTTIAGDAAEASVYRVVVEDAVSPLYVRHVVKDVLTDQAVAADVGGDSLSVEEGKAVFHGTGPTGPSVVVTFDPFKIELMAAGAADGATPLITLNGQALLRYETHINPPPPPPPPSSPSPSPSPHDEIIDEDVDADAEGEEENGVGSADLPTAVKEEEEDRGLWEEKFQSHTDPKKRGPESIGMDVAFPFAEHLYGIPERTERLSLPASIRANGSVAAEPYRLYNLDVFEFELDKPLGLYGAVPYLVARKGETTAGMLWLNSAETYVDVFEPSDGGLATTGRVTHWFSETGRIDVFLIPGPSAHNVYRKYIMLTGAPAMPQRFALGYHQCRWNYRDDADARTVDGEFDKKEVPYDVLWLDIEHTNGKRYFTWDMGKFPDPTKLQNDIAARGRKMVTIIDPHVKRDSNYAVHKTAEEDGYYVKSPEGKPFEGWCWPGSSSYYDFTSGRARSAWATRFNSKDYPHFTEHLYTWVDMNEPSVFNGPEGTMPKHMLHEGNVEHRDVHNQYGFYVQQATFDGLTSGHGGNDRPFVLSRSFFAGSQRFGAVWTGDNTAAWDHLETSARMLLPLQLSGIIFSGADVGGFFGNPSTELLVRWYQAAAYQPFFRGHAHLDTNRREPWLFGDENTAIIRMAIRARYSYIPLWYTLMAGNALGADAGFPDSHTGPPMRPVWWQYPDDARLDDMEHQWMVGDALLVSPVVTEGVSSHTVYLPGLGPWYDLHHPDGLAASLVDGSGPREVEIPTPLERMVVFQRGGSIIPKQERVRRSTRAMARDPYTLVIALDGSGRASGTLYLDDGRSFDYSRGRRAVRIFEFSEGRLTARTAGVGGDDDNAGDFDGADAAVERIVVLGAGACATGDTAEVDVAGASGATRKAAVTCATRGAGFAAVVRRPDVAAGRGAWSVTLGRR